jgi:uncharacterized membrane protein HdeD (DUF308 family)
MTHMAIDRIYFAYMAFIGGAAGAILASAPAAQDFAVKPYFWMLIAVALFDGALYLRGRKSPGALLAMNARLIGFAIGMALMVAIPLVAGAPVRFF